MGDMFPVLTASVGESTGAFGSVTVAGPGSSWNISGGLDVGGNSGTGVLAISNGGSVFLTGSAFINLSSIGSGDGGSGKVTVDGAGSSLSVGALSVGYSDDTGSL